MPPALLLLTLVGPPLLLAAGLVHPTLRRWGVAATPAAAVPTLLAAVLAPAPPSGTILPLLTGVTIGFGEVGRALLVVTAVIWCAAGLRLAGSRPRGVRVVLFFLITQAGSFGALVALDPVGYYFFFSVMTVASYGLITVDDSPWRRWAGRLYLALSLAGEMAVIAAFMLRAAGVETPAFPLLVFFGLGAKLGVLPLHVSLPPAYAAAPVPGAAVLGGVLTTVAAAGWLRFLPLTEAHTQDAAMLMTAFGFAAAFLGAVLGALQRDAKALLGYSTVSQMGLLTIGTATALVTTWSTAAAAVAFFVFHHGLVKAALFLSLPRHEGRPAIPVLILLGLLSLALAGFPTTGGALAKTWLESLANDLPSEHWKALVHTLLPWTAAATTLLMARFLWLVGRRPEPASTPVTGTLLAAVALVLPWGALLRAHPATAETAMEPGHLVTQTWPVLAGVAAFALGGVLWKAVPALSVPAGDVAAWAQRAWTRRGLGNVRLRRAVPAVRLPAAHALRTFPRAADVHLRSLAVAGFLFSVGLLTLGLLTL